jgi:hypothetical protein
VSAVIRIGDMLVDAAIREEHSFEADVSEHPVEKGANITDHVRARPPMLVIEGIVSDTPLADDVIAARPVGETPSTEARARLFDIWHAGEPVEVETTVAVYSNMIMQSFVITEDAETGEACGFRATFKQIRIVTNKRSTLRVAVPNGKKKLNRGSQPSSPTAASGGSAQSPPVKATRSASQGARLANRISLINNGKTNYQVVE